MATTGQAANPCPPQVVGKNINRNENRKALNDRMFIGNSNGRWNIIYILVFCVYLLAGASTSKNN